MRKPISTNPDPESAPFWDAARRGELLLRHCRDCNQVHWFARSICPFCWSTDTDWTRASGQGHIYSWTVMRRSDHPYAIAYVELAEGPRMLTNIVECELDALAIGQMVEVVFMPTTDPDGPPVAIFRTV